MKLTASPASRFPLAGPCMTTLLLPCAGKSSRYPGVRPKWMLTTPDGVLAVQQAAKSVDDGRIRRRVIAICADHDKNFGASTAIRRAFGTAVEIVVIAHDTNGPAETVFAMIEEAKIDGPIIIKDADSFFAPAVMPEGSFVAATDLRLALDIARVGAKSFLVINEQGLVSGIVEKEVASNFISSGAYAFGDAGRFVTWLKAIRGAATGEVFVSHVVSEGLRTGEVFRPYFVRRHRRCRNARRLAKLYRAAPAAARRYRRRRLRKSKRILSALLGRSGHADRRQYRAFAASAVRRRAARLRNLAARALSRCDPRCVDAAWPHPACRRHGLRACGPRSHQ